MIAAARGLMNLDLRIGKPGVPHHVIEIVGQGIVDATYGAQAAEEVREGIEGGRWNTGRRR